MEWDKQSIISFSELIRVLQIIIISYCTTCLERLLVTKTNKEISNRNKKSDTSPQGQRKAVRTPAFCEMFVITTLASHNTAEKCVGHVGGGGHQPQ